MSVLGQAVPLEKRQAENVGKQIALVRLAQSLSSNEKRNVYRDQLFPLIEQEGQIERERENSKAKKDAELLQKKYQTQ